MDGNFEAELLALEEVIRIGVSIILLCFEEPALRSVEVVGGGIFLLVDASAKGGSSTLVTAHYVHLGRQNYHRWCCG